MMFLDGNIGAPPTVTVISLAQKQENDMKFAKFVLTGAAAAGLALAALAQL
jgi:hypothetical protein